MSSGKTAEELEAIIYDIGSRIGAALEPVDVIRTKVIEWIQTAPRPEYPVKMHDGVVYRNIGCVEYPPEHLYSKMERILNEFAHESPALQARIEKATGYYLADGGARAMSPLRRWLIKLLKG